MAFGARDLCGLAVLLAAASLPAPAPAQGLQHDTSLPIEITADRLEVEQNQRLATFSGNVDAVQGEMVLSADQLRVYYYGQDDARPAAASSSGSIRRIEAEGNVFVSSPRETAQGSTGVYDVASSELSLEGSVVLTQDDNVIRGDRLEIDLASGRSRVLAALAESDGGQPAQRVRAIFTPQNATPAGAAAKAADRAPAASQ